MPKVSFQPAGTVCDVTVGTTILRASNAYGAGLSSCCGGRAICTTCRVEVLDGMDQLSKVEDYESDMLELLRIGASFRLGCQARVHGDIVVRIP